MHNIAIVVSALAMAATGTLNGTIEKVQVYEVYFGSAIAFATKAYRHTVQQLWAIARILVQV